MFGYLNVDNTFIAFQSHWANFNFKKVMQSINQNQCDNFNQPTQFFDEVCI